MFIYCENYANNKITSYHAGVTVYFRDRGSKVGLDIIKALEEVIVQVVYNTTSSKIQITSKMR